MDKKKVLIVHPSLGSGGAEKIIAFLANTLSFEYAVDLLLLKSIPGTLPLAQSICVIKKDCYEEMPIISRHLPRGVKSLKALVNVIAEQYQVGKYDLAICFDLRVLLAMYGALKKEPEKILFSERADPYANKKYWAWILKFIYKRIGYVVFQTEGARDFYGKIVEKKSCIIHNPALNRNLSQEYIASVEKKKIIFSAGRFQHRKGFDLLVRAFATVANVDMEYRVKIYGQGGEEQYLRELIREFSLEERVDILPPIPNVVEENADAALFVLPSRSEGIPNIMIEAMVAGTPCIACDCTPGGARLLSGGGKFARLARNDDYENLAVHLEYAITHPEAMCAMARDAQNSIMRFSPEQIGKEWRYVIGSQIYKKEQN